MTGFASGNSARHQTSVSVSSSIDRLDTARLAVALVAQEDAVGARRARQAQAHDGVAAELVGPLEHVQVGAVVVRLVEQRAHRLASTLIP